MQFIIRMKDMLGIWRFNLPIPISKNISSWIAVVTATASCTILNNHIQQPKQKHHLTKALPEQYTSWVSAARGRNPAFPSIWSPEELVTRTKNNCTTKNFKQPQMHKNYTKITEPGSLIHNTMVTHSPACPQQHLRFFSSPLQIQIGKWKKNSPKKKKKKKEIARENNRENVPGWDVRKENRSKRWSSCSLDNISEELCNFELSFQELAMAAKDEADKKTPWLFLSHLFFVLNYFPTQKVTNKKNKK